MNSKQILKFWFHPDTIPFQFAQNDGFDQLIHQQYSDIHRQASQCELWHWRETAEGRLAEIIILDQFSRNLYRNSARAFAQDALALSLAQEAIQLKLDQTLPPEQRAFLYMPFMHSESKLIHQHALTLFTDLANANSLEFEIRHKAIIDRFGHYPHRNDVLGRVSTAEELEFLTQPNSRF
jgi:uncharacterized protein (DUF924 family)